MLRRRRAASGRGRSGDPGGDLQHPEPEGAEAADRLLPSGGRRGRGAGGGAPENVRAARRTEEGHLPGNHPGVRVGFLGNRPVVQGCVLGNHTIVQGGFHGNHPIYKGVS